VIELKTGILLAGLVAVGVNVPIEDDSTLGVVARFIGLGATGIIAALTWRLIDVFGKAVARNTDAVDRMREHCSARNGEAPPDRRNAA
jgi:hypothetical protein